MFAVSMQYRPTSSLQYCFPCGQGGMSGNWSVEEDTSMQPPIVITISGELLIVFAVLHLEIY